MTEFCNPFFLLHDLMPSKIHIHSRKTNSLAHTHARFSCHPQHTMNQHRDRERGRERLTTYGIQISNINAVSFTHHTILIKIVNGILCLCSIFSTHSISSKCNFSVCNQQDSQQKKNVLTFSERFSFFSQA